MQSLAFYLLKVIACSGILLLYYRLALRNKRFHYYNRFYLLATIAASILLPLLKINWFTITSDSDKAVTLLNVMYLQTDEVIVHSGHQGYFINWQQAPLFLYSLVSISFMVVLIWRIRKIYAFKKQYSATSMGEFDFINTDLSQAPFSFLQNLFWRTDIDLNETTGRQILQHELTHIRQKHTLDKLCMQIVLSVFWINPFYWFIQKELFLLHEFIADEKAIENNDGAAFAAMLLTSQYGKSIFSPGQSFAYSPIKRRLFMLTNLTKPRYSYARRIMVLPLLAFVVLLSAFRLQKKAADTDNNNITPVETPLAAADTTINGIAEMPAKDTTPKSIVIEERADNAYATDTLKPTLQLRNTSLVYGYKTQDSIASSQIKALLFINGVETPVYDLHKLEPNDIQSIQVLKDYSATQKYGARAANGVIEIYTKTYASTHKTPPVSIQLDYVKPEKTILANLTSTRDADTVHLTADTVIVRDITIAPRISSDTVIEVKGYKTKDKNLSAVTVTGYKSPKKNSNDPITITGYKRADKNAIEEVVVTGYSSVTEQAHFPGGAAAWQKYLKDNLQAGIVAKKGGPPGRYTVIVSFMVDEDGNISEVRAETDPGYGTAAEAVRVIQHGPNWVPAKQKDKVVKYRQKQAITFAVDEK